MGIFDGNQVIKFGYSWSLVNISATSAGWLYVVRGLLFPIYLRSRSSPGLCGERRLLSHSTYCAYRPYIHTVLEALRRCSKTKIASGITIPMTPYYWHCEPVSGAIVLLCSSPKKLLSIGQALDSGRLRRFGFANGKSDGERHRATSIRRSSPLGCCHRHR